MTDISNKYDDWLKEAGPAALVIREHLMPVEGPDGVLFPATFADVGYNIDEFPDGKNVCLIDSVGSQANRIEPLFAKGEYTGLVPQVVVKAGEIRINLLEAGHRAGDAIVRCSALKQELQNAFKAVQKGNAEPLAKIAPTSLVFGAWDSRDTQAKVPRLIASTIRAFNVRKLTRSAQYVPAIDYVENKLLEEPLDKKTKDTFAERGFIHVPAPGSHGGVIADGGVRRDATLHLAALRLLTTEDAGKKTLALQRYILGLALAAFTYPPANYLRQGCNLVLDPDKKSDNKFEEVYCDGERKKATISHSEAIDYARVVASQFGVGPNRDVDFDKTLAAKDVSEAAGDGDKKIKRSKGKNTK